MFSATCLAPRVSVFALVQASCRLLTVRQTKFQYPPSTGARGRRGTGATTAAATGCSSGTGAVIACRQLGGGRERLRLLASYGRPDLREPPQNGARERADNHTLSRR
jgi:hypothetical protein